MPAGFRRHLVGKTLRNVFYSAVSEVRFVGIMWTFLKLTGEILLE